MGDATTATIKEALSLLSLAGITTPVIHSATNGIPLGAENLELIMDGDYLLLLVTNGV